jgi:hypothetical protein
MPESEQDRWDAQLEESDLREQAASAWGTDAQLNKAAEEFAELAAAINRDLNGQQDRDEFLRELTAPRASNGHGNPPFESILVQYRTK